MHYIVVSNQKGGISKTVISCMLANLLATNSHPSAPARTAQKVLVVDLDLQGDATNILTNREREEFEEYSVFDAINSGDAASYITEIHEHLHLLAASSKLAMFDELFASIKGSIDAPEKLLERVLQPIAKNYDFIIVDTAPSLSQLKLQAMNVSFGGRTNVLIPLQTKKLGFNSVFQFAKTLHAVKTNTNPQLHIMGIVPVLTDATMRIDKLVMEEAREAFGELLFDTVIRRRSGVEMMIDGGFSETYAKQRDALEDFYKLHEEVIAHVEGRKQKVTNSH